MDPHTLQLDYYLRTLWKGRLLILLTTAIALLAAVVYAQTVSPPSAMYEATATILVSQAPAESARQTTSASASFYSPSAETVNTQIELVTSRRVLERAVQKLQPPGVVLTPEERAQRAQQLSGVVAATVILRTNLMEITVAGSSPEIAERRANAVAEAYIDHVKAERSRSIQEAVDRITAELQGVKSPTDVSRQATAALPRLGAELASLRRAVEANTQGLQQLQNQTNTGAVNAVRLELPMMEKSARALDSISRELKSVSEAMRGRQRQGPADVSQLLSSEGSRLDRTANDLQVITQEIQAIRAQVNKVESFETAARYADQVAVIVDQILPQTSTIQISTIDEAQKLAAIGGYADSIKLELQGSAATLRQASATGAGLTENQRSTLKSQATGYDVGLTSALNDLRALRNTQGEYRVYGQLLVVEGQVGAALDRLKQLSAELNNLDRLAALHTSLSKSAVGIEEVRVSLKDISRVFTTQDSPASGQRNAAAVTQAQNDVRRAMLVLNVTSQELRSHAQGVQHPYLTAQVNQVADELWSIAPGGDATLVDQLTTIQGRVQVSADQLWVTWQKADSQVRAEDLAAAATASSNAHSEAADIAISLDVAHRQITDLQSGGKLDPLVSGELNALADRLLTTKTSMEGAADRLETAEKNFTKEPPRELVEGQQRLEAASESLGRAATLNTNLPADASAAVFRNTMIQMNDQTDAAGAILTWVADSLTTLKLAESDPTRFGQLSVLEERIRASQARTAKVSDEFELLQDAGGPGYIDLIKLQQELQLSLLAPQETGISIVDSAALPPAISKTAFFYKIRIPLGAVVGLLAGSLFVLARDQSDTSVRTLGKLRAQVAAVPLGVIPRSKDHAKGDPLLISYQEPSQLSDALQLVAAGLDEPLKSGARSLLITSAGAKDGKTTLAVNLARALARQGRRVLLVDADLRKPEVAKILRLPADEGLASALALGRNPLDLVQIKDNFSVLPAGRPPANPIELVFSDAMSTFLKQAEALYDVVVVDGPPALGNAEIKGLAKNLHQVVLVVRSGAYSGDQLKQAQEDLQSSGAELAGTVLNFATAEECSHLTQHGDQAPSSSPRDLRNQKKDWLGRKVLKPQTLFSRLLGQ